MINKLLYIYLLVGLALSIAVGCSSGGSDVNDKDELSRTEEVAETMPEEPDIEISDEVIFDIIQKIPSPIETASYLKASGAGYKEDLLNSSSNVSNYTTSFQKAINLGVYGADLGYINIYDNATDAIIYLSSIIRLSEDLRVSQFFDFDLMKRIASNRENLDSLLHISTVGFEKMNDYLKDKKRGNMGVFMLVGGWIEGLHFMSQICAQKPSDELMAKLGEQKITLDEIMLLLRAYKKDPNINQLIPSFDELKIVYDEVTITTKYAEPTTKEVDGMLVVIDNSISTVDITDEVAASITEKVSNIRNLLIN